MKESAAMCGGALLVLKEAATPRVMCKAVLLKDRGKNSGEPDLDAEVSFNKFLLLQDVAFISYSNVPIARVQALRTVCASDTANSL